MKKGSKKVLSLLIAFGLILGVFAGCGKTNKEGTTSTAKSQATGQDTKSKASVQPVTLKVYNKDPITEYGIQSDPIAKEIERITGVTMDFVANPSDDTLKLLLASRDLPDIFVTDSQYQKQLIEGNDVIAMDDLLKTNGKDILLNPKRIEYSKKFMSNGTGKVYFLPTGANASMKQAAGDFLYSSMLIRWDYYKELGCPEIKSWDDLINVLAQMQKNHPKTEDGKKTYGLEAFNEWDMWSYIGGMTQYYYDIAQNGDILNAVYLDRDKNIHQTYYEDNSYFWDGMRNWNKAYRAGIVDPDSFTQKFDTARQKGYNGQVFCEQFSWVYDQANANFVKKGQPEAGFMPIYTVFPTVYTSKLDAVGTVSPSLSITSKCKTPDRAMDLINFCSSYDGCRLIFSGIKGVHWDVENGKPELKDETYTKKAADSNYKDNEGLFKYNKLAAWWQDALNPNDGAPMDLTKTPKAFKKLVTPLEKSFDDYYKVDYPGQLCDKLITEGKVAAMSNPCTIAQGSLGIPSDDIKRIDTQITSYIDTQSIKLVTAKTDADFKKEKEKTIAELEKLGLKKSMDYWTEKWKAALPVIDEFKP